MYNIKFILLAISIIFIASFNETFSFRGHHGRHMGNPEMKKFHDTKVQPLFLKMQKDLYKEINASDLKMIKEIKKDMTDIRNDRDKKRGTMEAKFRKLYTEDKTRTRHDVHNILRKEFPRNQKKSCDAREKLKPIIEKYRAAFDKITLKYAKELEQLRQDHDKHKEKMAPRGCKKHRRHRQHRMFGHHKMLFGIILAAK